MHIPNGLLDPKISAGLGFASAGALAYCFSKAREAVASPVMQEAVASAGKMASGITIRGRRVFAGSGAVMLSKIITVWSVIFVAQMFDFKVPLGSTGHLFGGALAGIFLGPWVGGFVMAAVVTIQCLALSDGGALALGANIFNMAVIGTIGAYFIYWSLTRMIKAPVGHYAGVAVAAWISIVLAAGATSFELGLSGAYPMLPALREMGATHAVVGIAEAFATLAGLALLDGIFNKTEGV